MIETQQPMAFLRESLKSGDKCDIQTLKNTMSWSKIQLKINPELSQVTRNLSIPLKHTYNQHL